MRLQAVVHFVIVGDVSIPSGRGGGDVDDPEPVVSKASSAEQRHSDTESEESDKQSVVIAVFRGAVGSERRESVD